MDLKKQEFFTNTMLALKLYNSNNSELVIIVIVIWCIMNRFVKGFQQNYL